MKLLSIVFIFIFSLSAFGQKSFVSVDVYVQSANKDVGSTVQSYIEREIRSLGDVEVTTKNPFYSMAIIVLENKTIDGQTYGYTLSTVVTRQGTCQSFNKTTYPCQVYEDHGVNAGATDSLRRICESIIVRFDTRSIKPLRPK